MGILWIFCSLGCVGLYPLWEGRGSLARVSRGIMLDLRGGKGMVVRGEVAREESVSSEGMAVGKEVGELDEKKVDYEMGSKK